MRVHKDQVIGGMPAILAREVVRRLGSGDSVAAAIEDLLRKYGFEEPADKVVKRLQEEGFVELAATTTSGEWWTTTIAGNALAMASFGSPITRKTADRLVAGLLDRTREMNSDPAQLLAVERIRLFGSYLHPDIDPLGDIDIELSLARRVPGRVLIEYGKASSKQFPHFTAQLHWAETEFVQKLRNKSTALNFTREDVGLFTDAVKTVYLIGEDPSAVPLPSSKGDE